MLDPSPRIVVATASGALISLFLGLATDIGVFGWSLAVLAALYLTAATLARRARQTSP
jgi:hypothetical protein